MHAENPARPLFDLIRARTAIKAEDAGSLAACLGTLPDAEAHDLADRAGTFFHGTLASVAQAMAPHFGAAVQDALHAALGNPLPHPYRIESRGQDFIAQQSGLAEWGVDQALTRLAYERIPFAKHSAAVVGTMRDDGIYILEWVAHYRTLGFEHLFIYTNDNADGSDALLQRLAEAGLLTVIDNEVTGEVPPEVKAFGHALNLLPALWAHEWAFFVDSDEFLVPAPHIGNRVSDILQKVDERYPSGEVGAVLYDWLWYVSAMKFRREPGLLMERFQYTRDHWLGKCLVRLRDTTSMRRQHCPDLIPGKMLIDSAFEAVDLDNFWNRSEPQYAGGQVNHYWPKSFEEFAIKKARGAAFGGDDNPYDRPYRKFFEWNGLAEPGRQHPPRPAMLSAVHQEIQRLRSLPGVAEAQDQVERGFARRLSEICSPEQLLALYERNRVPPGDL